MRQLHVRYGVSPRSRAELAFAIDLAGRLSGRLFVWTEIDHAARALLYDIGIPGAADQEHAHVSDRVRLLIARMGADVELTFCQGDPYRDVHDPHGFVIGPRGGQERPIPASVATMGEATLGARGATEICLPFANGESAVDAAMAAIPLAHALGAPVLLYHTTWREEGLPSDAEPERHMTEEASVVLRRIRAMADLMGVRHRTVVETTTGIAEGTLRTALNEHCALVALARGRHVGRGSYVDQMLERSVIPVLVAGRSQA